MKQLTYSPLRADGSPVMVTYCPTKMAYAYGFLPGTARRCPQFYSAGPMRRRGDATRIAQVLE